MKETVKNVKFAWTYAKGEKRIVIKFVLVNILSIAISILVPILSSKVIIALTKNAYYQIIFIIVLNLLII